MDTRPCARMPAFRTVYAGAPAAHTGTKRDLSQPDSPPRRPRPPATPFGQHRIYGLPFYTSPDALIPRPETETLVEIVLDQLKNVTKPRILDIGTGSGIIAITLSKALTGSHVIATDISRKALYLASQNACLNGVSNRISFLQTDLLTPFAPPEGFDAILSNPPYIPSHAIDALQPEVRACDPHLALDGGCDGLDFYRKIIPTSVPLLAPDGLLGLEIGHDQADAVTQLLARQSGPHPHRYPHRPRGISPRGTCAGNRQLLIIDFYNLFC